MFIKDFKDPVDDYKKNIGLSKAHSKLKELQQQCLQNIEASSNDRQLEKKALELKSKWVHYVFNNLLKFFKWFV